MIHNNQTSSGFALLITLLVVSVIISVTAAIVELSLKQLALSVTARDSEIAFHAANAGAECARYIQRMASTSIINGNNQISTLCFDTTFDMDEENNYASVDFAGPAPSGYTTRRYRNTVDVNAPGVTWNNDRCTQIDMLVVEVDFDETDLTISDLSSLYPGYSSGDRVCQSGSTCYIAEVSGYNNPCDELTTADTVRREVLLEF